MKRRVSLLGMKSRRSHQDLVFLQPNFTVDRKGEAAIKERQLQEDHQD